MQLSLAAAHAQPATANRSASQALLHDDRELAHWVSSHSPDVEASRAELRGQRAARPIARTPRRMIMSGLVVGETIVEQGGILLDNQIELSH